MIAWIRINSPLTVPFVITEFFVRHWWLHWLLQISDCRCGLHPKSTTQFGYFILSSFLFDDKHTPRGREEGRKINRNCDMIRQLFLIRWIIKMVGNNNKEKTYTHRRSRRRWKREGPNANAKATRNSVLIIIYIYLFVSRSFLHTDAQPFAAWIVDQMVSASRANVDVIQASLEIYVINCHAIPAAPSMDNVRTERACARKDGMDAIAHCVSICHTTPALSIFFFLFFPFSLNFSSNEFGHRETGTKTQAQLRNYTNEMSWISSVFFNVVQCVKQRSRWPSMRRSESTPKTIWSQILCTAHQKPSASPYKV